VNGVKHHQPSNQPIPELRLHSQKSLKIRKKQREAAIRMEDNTMPKRKKEKYWST
jgi:hypothetical protein